MQFGAGTPVTRAKSHISLVVQDGEQFRPRLRELVEQVIVDEKQIVIKVRHAALLRRRLRVTRIGGAGTGTIELTTAVDFKRRGVETKVVLPGLAQQSVASRCDPALIKAVVRGRAWFEELATGLVRSLEDLTKRDGISRRYIRRLVDLAFLSPRLVDAIVEGRHSLRRRGGT